MEEEKRNTLVTSPSLLCLPPELLVMLASCLEVSSYLALASSSNALLDILLSQNQWKTLLKKTRWGTGQGRMNNEFIYPMNPMKYPYMSEIWDTEEDDVELIDLKKLTNFLRYRKDPEGKLLLSFLDLICERFPADPSLKYEDVVSVSCPRHKTHQVTPFGFALLERAEMLKEGGGQPHQKLLEYKLQGVVTPGEHLKVIASRSSHQKQKVKRIDIRVADSSMDDSDKRFMESWSNVLKHCNVWNIKILYADEWKDVDKMLEALAKESSRGTIGRISRISDRIIGRVQKAQLKQLWKITSEEWRLSCAGCFDTIGTIRKDEGWGKVLDAIRKVQTKEYAHYKICRYKSNHKVVN